MSNPKVQVAIDVNSVHTAIRLARAALAAGADWLEIGKPLIEFEGIKGCRALCEQFPNAYFLMDLMLIAAPAKYIAAAGDMGVSNVTVTALAPPETVAAAIAAGKDSGVAITVDLFNTADPAEHCVRYADMGADYLMVHFGVDQKRARPSGSPIEDLRQVVERVSIPVSYATYDITESIAAVHAGASVIVQGQPLLDAPDPEQAFRMFIEQTKAAAGGVR